MTDIPPEILAEIEADVARYREGRINAARKKLTPEFLANLERRREWESLDANEIVNWFVGGETTFKIAARYKYVTRDRIVGEIKGWLWNRLNPGPFDENTVWVDIGPFSERTWPARIFNLPPR